MLSAAVGVAAFRAASPHVVPVGLVTGPLGEQRPHAVPKQRRKQGNSGSVKREGGHGFSIHFLSLGVVVGRNMPTTNQSVQRIIVVKSIDFINLLGCICKQQKKGAV